MILLCYDGSDDAKDAAENAAKLFPATPVTVLAVWEPYIDVPTQDGFGLTYLPAATDVEEIAAGMEQHARATAQEGADRLKQAGIAAQPSTEVRVRAWPRRSSTSRTRSTPMPSCSARTAVAASSRCCWEAFRTPSSSTPTGRSS